MHSRYAAGKTPKVFCRVRASRGDDVLLGTIAAVKSGPIRQSTVGSAEFGLLALPGAKSNHNPEAEAQILVVIRIR
jgi:hypothetical protein